MGILSDIRKERIVAGKPVIGKGLLRSKTFWVNALTGVASLLTAVGGVAILPPSVSPYLAGGLAIVNVLLRLFTKEPIVSVK